MGTDTSTCSRSLVLSGLYRLALSSAKVVFAVMHNDSKDMADIATEYILGIRFLSIIRFHKTDLNPDRHVIVNELLGWSSGGGLAVKMLNTSTLATRLKLSTTRTEDTVSKTFNPDAGIEYVGVTDNTVRQTVSTVRAIKILWMDMRSMDQLAAQKGNHK